MDGTGDSGRNDWNSGNSWWKRCQEAFVSGCGNIEIFKENSIESRNLYDGFQWIFSAGADRTVVSEKDSRMRT